MKIENHIKTFIFDMDGTLIDTEKYYRICWPKALADFGYKMTDEQALLMRSLGIPFAPLKLREMFGEELEYAAVRNRRKELMEACIKEEGIQLKKGAKELLSYLREKKISTAIATATDMERATEYLKQLDLLPFFEHIISATMVEEGKPSPDIYLYACEQLGQLPEHCIAVEDSPNGVLSAYRAGCNVIMIPDQSQPDKELSGLLYAKADSLLDIIKMTI